MTKVKLCGLSRPEDIETANELLPDYIGFVLVPASRRYVAPEQAARLRAHLSSRIRAVGVFADEEPEKVAALCRRGLIDLIQLHGREDEAYLDRLRRLTQTPVIQAYRIRDAECMERALRSSAEMILLDAGAGEGLCFDWSLLEGIRRPYFLAGGLDSSNVAGAIRKLAPYAVDVSSGIETGGKKDRKKMHAFVRAVREETVQ